MYFESRAQAGAQLAAELFERYRYENCVVVALSDGAVMVGEQIAASLHCILTMLLIENIEVPGESMSFGGVSQNGSFTFNGSFSAGEIDEYASEYHGYLDEQKREAFHRINRLLGDGGLINSDMLRDHVVILVSDGLAGDATLDAAVDFLKPIRIGRLVIASPSRNCRSSNWFGPRPIPSTRSSASRIRRCCGCATSCCRSSISRSS